MRLRSTLRRWHSWLGWLIGLPLLCWTLSGVIMVWKPIEEVRGAGLLRPLPPVRLTTPVVPPKTSRKVATCFAEGRSVDMEDLLDGAGEVPGDGDRQGE